MVECLGMWLRRTGKSGGLSWMSSSSTVMPGIARAVSSGAPGGPSGDLRCGRGGDVPVAFQQHPALIRNIFSRLCGWTL